MNYYTEIETYIKKNEVSKKARVLEENQSTLENYGNIDRLLVEAQGGEKRSNSCDSVAIILVSCS